MFQSRTNRGEIENTKTKARRGIRGIVFNKFQDFESSENREIELVTISTQDR